MVLLLASCSTTNHIPEDDQLYVGLKKIVYTDYEKNDHAIETQEEIEGALATPPNGALFGSSYYRSPFPIGLWIWNATTGRSSKLSQWINRVLGKAPVLMSQVNPALRAQVARQVLRSNGYMHGDVSYVEVTQKNPKKAKIAYTVRMDSLFTVDSMSYVGFPSAMNQLIDSTREEAVIATGKPFSVSLLDGERSRLSQLFRNNGYYYFQPAYASYLADTFQTANRAQLRLQLADSLPPEALRPWYIGTTTIQLRRNSRERLDTTEVRRFIKVMYSGSHAPIRPGVVLANMKLRPRRRFSYDDYQESMQTINATGVFSNIDFQFTPRDNDTLDLLLNCTFDKPYDFYVETNFINRTIGRMGPGLKVGLTRRNVFRGGEKLDINLHGSYEWQTNGGKGDMNTYQYGMDASIEFPRILFPRFSKRSNASSTEQRRPRRRRRYISTPWTIAKMSSDVARRPEYYKMHIVSGEWTYRWQPSLSSNHEFSPLTLKYQFMNSHTDRFDSLVAENPYLATTMSDIFIPKMRYTYSYSSPSSKRNPLHWEVTLQESGNVIALYDMLVQGYKWNQRDKTLFKNPYSQFVKLEADITKTWTLSTNTKLVGHASVGLMWTYGNSNEAPFSEMFYVGGANSIRAFPARSIGPGAFLTTGGSAQDFSYLLQNGDSKLQFNLELRHRLFGNLYGAVFFDAGNVWLSEDRTLTLEDIGDVEGGEAFVSLWNYYFTDNKFKFRNLLNQLATGTGIGLRYDMEFLVLRLDWGLGLHLPCETNKSGYFNIDKFKDMNTINFAIGYPF